MRTKLSSKGQVVLPKEIRDRQGWRTGSEMEVEEVPDGVLLKLAAGPRNASLADLVGCTGYRGKRKSLAQMQAAIRTAARKRK